MQALTQISKKYTIDNPEITLDIYDIVTVNLSYGNIKIVTEMIEKIMSLAYKRIDKSALSVLESLKVNYLTKVGFNPDLSDSDKIMIDSVSDISNALNVQVGGKDTCKYIIMDNNIGIISVYPIGTVCKRNIVVNSNIEVDDDKDIFTIIGIYIGYKGSVRYAVQPRYGDAVILPENALVFD